MGAPAGFTGLVETGTDVTVVTDATGYGSTTLIEGEHWVWLPDSERRRIKVGRETTYLLQDLLGLVGVVEATVNYQFVGDWFVLINDTTGNYHVWRVDGAAAVEQTGFDPANTTSGPANYRLTNGNLTFQLWNETQQDWQMVFVVGAPGLEQLGIAPVGATLAENVRFAGGLFQLLNKDTGLWHTLYVTGEAGEETLAISLGIA
jgi:hypothetical protein